MSTPFTDKFALFARNNEAVNALIRFRDKETGEPADLTGFEFFGQVRGGKTRISPLLFNLDISVAGDPLDGIINIHVPSEIMAGVRGQKAYYDVLYRVNGGDIDNLYVSPFTIGDGISDPSEFV